MIDLSQKSFQPLPGTQTGLWSSFAPRLLLYTSRAARRQRELIGWLRKDFPRNRCEQGGLLIGRHIRDAEGRPFQAEVLEVLEAQAETRTPGYIEWSGMEEIRLQRQFWALKEKLARSDPALAEQLCILGWWHTHPNDLPVFMSSIDREQQALKYPRPEQYAVVLNPCTGIWRAYAGGQAEEVPAVMLLEEAAPAVPGLRIFKGKPLKIKKPRKRKKRRKQKVKKS